MTISFIVRFTIFTGFSPKRWKKLLIIKKNYLFKVKYLEEAIPEGSNATFGRSLLPEKLATKIYT